MLYLSASCYFKASTKTNFIQHKSKYHDSLSNIQEPLQDHLAINLILNKRGKNAWLSVYLAVCFLSVCQSTSLSICLPVVYSIFLLFCLSVCCSICMLVCPIYRSDRLFVDQLSVNLSKISNFGTVSPILRIQRAIYVRIKFPVDLDAEKSRNRARNHVFFPIFDVL